MKVVIDGVSYIEMPPEVKPTNLALALDLRFDSNIGDNITIRDYLYNLLSELWRKEEGFSGKRPFGNSGWKHDLYFPLIKHGVLKGSLEDGKYPDNFDVIEADHIIANLIKIIFYGKKEK